MMLTLNRISRTSEYEYETLFKDEAGNSIVVNCSVSFDKAVPFIIPKPDIFMDGRADARNVSAAVLAFYRAQRLPEANKSNDL